jgi:hypothetical protein
MTTSFFRDLSSDLVELILFLMLMAVFDAEGRVVGNEFWIWNRNLIGTK